MRWKNKEQCRWCDFKFAKGTTGIGIHTKKMHPEVWAAGKDLYYGCRVTVTDWDPLLIAEWQRTQSELAGLVEAERESRRQDSSEDDPIRPAHYRAGGFEAKDVLNAWFPTDPLLWNCGKYLSRAGRKSSLLEDLKKAQQYLSWAIEREEARR